jgi:hypothetical protein
MVTIAQRRNGRDRASDPVDDYPVPDDPLLARRDLRYGQMAVVIHQAEQWPDGPLCRNCRGRWPCRLYRWGFQLLTVAEWTPADIRHLQAQADAGVVPWT